MDGTAEGYTFSNAICNKSAAMFSKEKGKRKENEEIVVAVAVVVENRRKRLDHLR